MDGSTQRCRSAKGEPSVCVTDPDVSPPSYPTQGLCNWVFMPPTALGLAVYLFEHIGCILYIVMSQSVLDMRSAYKVPTGSCPSMTVVFDVWYAVRL